MHFKKTFRTWGVVLALLTGQLAGAQATPDTQSGIELQYVDASVRPQDDIYRYLNGRWLDGTQMPSDQPSYGTFNKLYDEAQDDLRRLVETPSRDTGAAKGSESAKLRNLYRSFMGEQRIESLGAKPLAAQLARIDAIQDVHDLPALFAHMQRIGITVPFAASVHLDNRDATSYVYDVNQDGLGLPDRDYYLADDDARLKQIRDKYQAHVQDALRLLGDRSAAQEAVQIVSLETQLAKLQWTRVENRDPIRTYNKVAVPALEALMPGFDWHRYLSSVGVYGEVNYLIVSQPSYFQGLASVLQETPLGVWKSYLRWHLLAQMSPYLARRFVDDRFAFYGAVLRGVPQDRPRWKRGIQLVDECIGEGLGRLYVSRYFPPERKLRAERLVQHLLDAYRQDIGELDWMGDTTKQEALLKLSKLTVKLGYPVRWRDYAALTIRPDDLVGNVERANEFEFQRNLNKLGSPVDRAEWELTPQTVNAYYNPEMNEIVFPAAILQAPFFNADADDAVNYGAIGSIIGHEISHAFDDQGSQYDGDGNLRDWWTPDDHARFAAKTRALVTEYSAFEPVPGYHLNGELTLGENIADNSGLAIAYKAYELSLAGRSAPVIDGLSGDQRFYFGFTQAWREKVRDNFAIELIKSDPHSISVDRVLGTLVNQPGFYGTFDVKPGDKMYLPPEQRVIIW